MRYVNNTKGYIEPKCNKEYCHIYFDNSNEEIKRNYFIIDDNVEKIKLVLDNRIQHLCGIFFKWDCVKKINVIKFNRNDITSLAAFFSNCKTVEEINFYDYPKKSITNMADGRNI